MRKVKPYNKDSYPDRIFFRLILGLIVILNIFIRLYFEVQLIRLGNDIAVLEVETKKLEQENRILENMIAEITSLKYLREEAERLGYKEVNANNSLHLQ